MARPRRFGDESNEDDIELTAAASLANSSAADTSMSRRADERPLLQRDDDEDEIWSHEEAPDEDISVPKAAADQEGGMAAAPGVFVWLLTLSAGLSGLLFGCEFFDGPDRLLSVDRL